MDRLNLTSDEARERVGRGVNDRYRRATSSIGLIVSRRVITDLVVDPTDVATYPDLPELTIDGMEKIDRITRIGTQTDPNGIFVLKPMTYDEITNWASADALPRGYAIKKMGPGQVIIVFDNFPSLASVTMKVYGYDIADTLSGTSEPFLPTDFHDILVEGTMADELRKMEKPGLAEIADVKYENRLSDLRMFIAKEAYLDIAQGKDKPGQLWYRPWFSRVGIWN